MDNSRTTIYRRKHIKIIMNEYLFCYWTERNDVCTDLEKIVKAANLESAIVIFKRDTVYKSIEFISRIPNTENVKPWQ